MNRILFAVERMNARLGGSKDLPGMGRSLDMNDEEFARFQELKSVAFAQGLLNLEEAETVYGYLGNAVSVFNRQSVGVKFILTKLYAELMEKLGMVPTEMCLDGMYRPAR